MRTCQALERLFHDTPLTCSACSTLAALAFPCRTNSSWKAIAARRASTSAPSRVLPGSMYLRTGKIFPVRVKRGPHWTFHPPALSQLTPRTPLRLVCAEVNLGAASLGAAAPPANRQSAPDAGAARRSGSPGELGPGRLRRIRRLVCAAAESAPTGASGGAAAAGCSIGATAAPPSATAAPCPSALLPCTAVALRCGGGLTHLRT
mmetsp:Transcript_104248/g.290399  ORF Transcript_104248/g.290399 Transcript_104248/m.290399 type:complete len:205 (+) Transcript_104248:443-1057(+)